MEKILEVNNLQVSFHTYAGDVKAVRGVSFELEKGETLAFVGESGCGKTVTAKAIMRLLQPPFAEIKKESKIMYQDKDVMKMSKKELQAYRGNDVGMIFQDPMTSLNPTMTIGKQIMESLMLHRKLDKKQAREEAIEMLRVVKISDAEKRVDDYPHQLSGGMRQRVMIAIALSCNPALLIADEPTTALDVTIQAQIMRLLGDLKKERDTAIILVTHDLGVVANFADRIQVMYAGQIIERGTAKEIFYHAKHPYTWALLASVPKLDTENKGELYALKGTPPDLILEMNHCPFADRCEYCMGICRETMPEETLVDGTHRVSCWLQHPSAPRVQSYYEKCGVREHE
ncbi:ABC transporter ATP-binding protein [Hespellia stercorisuis]|uniref:Oligopeptide transport system ATP-binding protein n=1 Tax=Hespellia stercorisuis DSM 15480 TaxID=1121950 RepID=A0A1M6KLY3_9FIRM|nr:ABC transporter ATP-binding protein [Hespellia stercorisuis]SHJ60018.1 oligopeptide transport system ATP-binding protein [Hespellia stercorisuis DSM 15480]